MRFEQVLNEDLGCASYFIACGPDAIVVDPRWDVAVYEELATKAGATIRFAVDTHHHADHVSGRGRLAARTGALALHPGGTAGDEVAAGDEFRVGEVLVRAIATPGHRPEHLSLTVTDTKRSTDPCAVLAGDSLLVGDVARPDLAVDPAAGARDLHASLQSLFSLGDHLELWPGHVGGSLCGGAGLSAKTSSTIGLERRVQPVFALGADDFCEHVALPGLPKPPNLTRVVQLNHGPLGDEPAAAPLLGTDALASRGLDAFELIDIRPATAFDACHLQGAACIPLGTNGAANRAAWASDPERPLMLVADREADARSFESKLHAVGLWDIAGIVLGDVPAWDAAALTTGSGRAIDVATLVDHVTERDVRVIDVRDPREYAGGHVAGSTSLPLPRIGDGRRVRITCDEPLVVVCARGPRAGIGASLLRRGGHQRVWRVAGGGVADLVGHGVELVA